VSESGDDSIFADRNDAWRSRESVSCLICEDTRRVVCLRAFRERQGLPLRLKNV